MVTIRRTFRAFLAGALLVASGVIVAMTSPASAEEALPSPPPVLQRDSSVVTSDPLPTVQIDDGYVWAQTTVGTTVYAAGMFTNARAALAAPGTSLTPRTNILAFDITSGNLLSFAPQVNGVIRSIAASPDGSRIYIGGSFTQVNGQARWNIAALDAQTGTLVPGFNPAIGGSGVYAITTAGNTVYAGGLFSQANGVARTNLAAFNAANGAVQMGWTPSTNLQVDAMVMDPNGQQVIIGGRFSQVNGDSTWRGLAALDLTTGVPNPTWEATQTIKNGATSGKAGIFGLTTDASGVYGTGWVYAGASIGNLEGAFAVEPGNGSVRWIADCLGDHYGIYSTGSVVYTTTHTHACSTMGLWPEQSPRTHRYAQAFTADVRGTLAHNPHAGETYADWYGTPSPAAYAWYPDFSVGTTSGLGQAGLSITGTGDYISIAGEFGSVNNLRYQGIVRFSTNPAGGAKDGPRTTTAGWGQPTATSVVSGRVGISIRAAWDRDDRDLTYELMRAGTAMPVDSKVVASGWWNTPQVLLQDTGLSPGSAQTYTVVVKDGDGNAVSSQAVNVTVAGGESAPYNEIVLDDSPSLYYPLGTATIAWAGNNQPVYGSAATSAGSGSGITDSATGSTDVAGNSNGYVTSNNSVAGPNVFSAEVWFKTSSTKGGKILGFGSSKTGSSSSYDRHVYMTNNGQLVFGVYPGSTQTLTSSSSYNDGKWHHVVASLGASGMQLHVDGQLVGSNASITTAQAYSGYWRLGGDNLSGWPSTPTSMYFDGLIDEFAVYPTELSASTVAAHYAAGSGLVPPTASFTATATDLTLNVDASTSSATNDATIAAYYWDFGDGTAPQSGVTASHTYATGGQYTVTLKVEDSNGLVSTQQQTVSVVGPNVPPVAEFSTATTGLTTSVNGSASSDSDGTIESYAWNWGDGVSSTSDTPTTSHSYAAAGTYAVTLTVTDDRGGATSVTHEVTVTHANPVATFTTGVTGLTLTADGTGSTASDGATLSYSWNWGDSATGSGAATTHTYAGGGTYDVTLTVTDSLGATATVTQQVTVAAIPFAVQDDFNRVIATGWGDADTGGTWNTVLGSASATSVSNGTGQITLGPGSTRAMALPGASVQDAATEVVYSLNAGPSTGAVYVGTIQRQTGSGGYTIQVWHRNNGSLWLVAQSPSGTIATVPLSGATWAAGDKFVLKTEVVGTSPTVINAKVWNVTASEPADWQLTVSDSTSGLQTAGYPSVRYYVAGGATSAITLSVDRIQVSDPATVPPAENVPPTAAFTANATGLTATVDAATSTDSDGTIASYSWDWGDGTPAGSGVNATHEYAADGTYTVTLTVTDDQGATNTTTQPVTVQSTPADDVVVQDTFDRTTTASWGTADVGGAWTITGGAASAVSVSDGAGIFNLAPGSTRIATLNQVSVKNVTATMQFSLSTGPDGGSKYVGMAPRVVGGSSYIVQAWLRPNGSVWLVAQNGGTVIATVPISGLTQVAGTGYTLTVQTVGDGSTTLQAKIWQSGTPEPASWQLTVDDSDAALQTTGSFALRAVNSSSSASAVQIQFLDVAVTQD